SENSSANELLVLSAALIKCRDSLRRDVSWPIAPVRWIVVQKHSPFAPIKHVDYQHDITLANQFRGQTSAAIIVLFEVRKDRMLAFHLDQLLLAPQVKASVIMQSNDGRRRQFRLFWNQQIRRYSNIRRRVEIDFFPGVSSLIHPLHNFRVGIAASRGVVQQ